MAGQSEDELRDFLASLGGEPEDPVEDTTSPTARTTQDLGHELTIEREVDVQEGISLCVVEGRTQALLRIEPGALATAADGRTVMAAIEQTVLRGMDHLGIVFGRRDKNISKALQLARTRVRASM